MNNEELATFLKEISRLLDEANSMKAARRFAGIIEGALITAKVKIVGTEFDYKDIRIENPNLLAPWCPGIEKTVMRKERYDELMLRWAREYISKYETNGK
jgi:hypothetical protein